MLSKFRHQRREKQDDSRSRIGSLDDKWHNPHFYILPLSLLALHASHLYASIGCQLSFCTNLRPNLPCWTIYITLGTPIFYQTELGQISESDLIKPTLDKIFQHIGRVTFESAHAGNVLILTSYFDLGSILCVPSPVVLGVSTNLICDENELNRGKRFLSQKWLRLRINQVLQCLCMFETTIFRL